MRQLGGTKTRKTRRSRKIHNALQTFRILYVNIRGLKSTVNSLTNIIAEKYPSVICLVETHLAKEDTISIEGYDLIFRNDSTSDSGSILIACENRLRSITVQVDEYSEVGQTLFIKLDNRRVQLRIGAIYAPQESRTLNQDLKKLYTAIEDNISEASQRNEKLVLIGDFNCKVGNCIQGNTETKTKGGRVLLKMVEKHNLCKVNANSNCQGIWTGFQNEEKSVIDYVITREAHKEVIKKMMIDESKESTPYRVIKENGETRKVYTDHNTILVEMKLVIDAVKGGTTKSIIIQKGYKRFHQIINMEKISKIMDKVILQEAYDEWTTKVEEAIRVVQTKVKKRNAKIMVKKLQRIKQGIRQNLKKTVDERVRKILSERINLMKEHIHNENAKTEANRIKLITQQLRQKIDFKEQKFGK